jgi:uncharacterized repeat protein (TIGR03803 family)
LVASLRLGDFALKLHFIRVIRVIRGKIFPQEQPTTSLQKPCLGAKSPTTQATQPHKGNLMKTRRTALKSCRLGVAALLSAFLCRDTAAQNVLATFDGTNGEKPEAGLVLSSSTLYGTTYNGGAHNGGTLFSIPVGGGAVTTLASFNGTNGAFPYSGLILVGSTLYGTTSGGGPYGYGTVFSIPVGGGPVTTLATFNGANGANPEGGLILSGSTLYGTTKGGGTYNDGTVFSLNITVPIPLNIQCNGPSVVLSWDDPASQFSLQSAPTMTGQFTNIPGAASPYTISITGAQQFFQLIGN